MRQPMAATPVSIFTTVDVTELTLVPGTMQPRPSLTYMPAVGSFGPTTALPVVEANVRAVTVEAIAALSERLKVW